MPIVLWIFRLIRVGGGAAARWAFRWYAADYLAALALAATKPHDEQDAYRDTLRAAKQYPSPARRIFFAALQEAATEAAWTALVAYARRVRETDPELREVADDVLAQS
jgi:hypothetical protein